MLAKTAILGALFITISSMAVAQTVVDVTCYSGGDRPVRTFSGILGAAEIVDLPQGGFNVKGRAIEIRRANSTTQSSLCRDWYLDVTETRYEGYAYYQAKRLWNMIKVELSSETKRMTCGQGSVLSEFDSVDAYKAKIIRENVESTPPAPGGVVDYHGYIDGLTTVSRSECVVFGF